MASRIWQVCMIDMEGSRQIPAGRRAFVDRALLRTLRLVERRHRRHIRLAPQMLKGDEVQCVLKPGAPALAMLTALRAEFASRVGRQPGLRAGLGLGAIERLSSKGPFDSDGQAFHRARIAIDSLKARRGRRMTAWVTGDPAFDKCGMAMIPLLDHLFRRWTVPQWKAIVGRLAGRGIAAIAREERVSVQAISLRLTAASWAEAKSAIEYLDALAARPGRQDRTSTARRGPGR
jgi:hypothetical protein